MQFRVPLPRISGDIELPYHNYTVMMHPGRRTCRYAASNIHGRLMHNIRRADGRTTWILDRRLERDEQFGNPLYEGTKIDKGHMVRRLDAAWWEARAEAMAANDDTFYYPNAAPQHEHQNEGDATWAGLEDHYLDHADAADRKISVFTGPVFRDDDPRFTSPDNVEAQIPLQFWKIIIYRRNNRLAADGDVLSQEQVLRDDPNIVLEEAFGGDQFETFQVPITEIESLTGLSFGDLSTGDTHEEGFGDESATTRGARRIRSLEDIHL